MDKQMKIAKDNVSISYNRKVAGSYNGSDKKAHFYRLSLLVAFVFLNVLTPVVLEKVVSFHYSKMGPKTSSGDFMKCHYPEVTHCPEGERSHAVQGSEIPETVCSW